jgi:hypothetical protein
VTSGRTKQRAHLDTVEAELLHRLLEHLPGVAAGRDTLFFTTREFNPFEMRVPTISQEIDDLAIEALAVRTVLGEPADGSVAQLFRAALAGSADLNDHHRLGPVRLAERLLSALHKRLPTGG